MYLESIGGVRHGSLSLGRATSWLIELKGLALQTTCLSIYGGVFIDTK
jgi:hypothetical protein